MTLICPTVDTNTTSLWNLINSLPDLLQFSLFIQHSLAYNTVLEHPGSDATRTGLFRLPILALPLSQLGQFTLSFGELARDSSLLDQAICARHDGDLNLRIALPNIALQ